MFSPPLNLPHVPRCRLRLPQRRGSPLPGTAAGASAGAARLAAPRRELRGLPGRRGGGEGHVLGRGEAVGALEAWQILEGEICW